MNLPSKSFLLLLVIFSFAVSKAEEYYYGYYWRDYDGLIPRDAFPGGLDENGERIYIGQVLFYDKLLTAKIYPGHRNVYYSWGTEYPSRENIKILCASHPERLKWVDTTHDGLHLLINTHLVKGGSEPFYDIYIGRAFHKMQTLIGRVRAGNSPHLNLGLYVSVPNKEVNLRSFEVLTYDPSENPAISEKPEKCTKTIIFKN